MPDAARVGDMSVCPKVEVIGPASIPHIGGNITGPGASTVKIGGMAAALEGDMLICKAPSPPDKIKKGSGTVKIEGKPAARKGDATEHGGQIMLGIPTVKIGG